mgnify:CR=1 FL=1
MLFRSVTNAFEAGGFTGNIHLVAELDGKVSGPKLTSDVLAHSPEANLPNRTAIVLDSLHGDLHASVGGSRLVCVVSQL